METAAYMLFLPGSRITENHDTSFHPPATIKDLQKHKKSRSVIQPYMGKHLYLTISKKVFKQVKFLSNSTMGKIKS